MHTHVYIYIYRERENEKGRYMTRIRDPGAWNLSSRHPALAPSGGSLLLFACLTNGLCLSTETNGLRIAPFAADRSVGLASRCVCVYAYMCAGV